MNLELITVGNGDKSYPGNFTKKEKEILQTFDNGFANLYNLFSGKSKIGNIRVDFNCDEATINMDVFKYLENVAILNSDARVIIDAPYNQKFADKYKKIGNTLKQFIIFADSLKTSYLFKLIIDKINPESIIIKSWNYYVPKGYHDVGSYLCYAGGYRKPTILMICSRDE